MKKVVTLLTILLLLSPFVFSETTTPAGTYDDLARKVEKKIRDHKKIRIENLKVLHQDGKIYLEGSARLYGSRYEAEQIALKFKGVTEVENRIEVIPYEATDLDIQGELIPKIRKHVRGTPFDLISVEVKHGFVRLTGSVRDTTLIDEAMEAAIWIRGVRGVENHIQKASIASGDERLRQIIYGRLYREYPQYFTGSYPSILILVESGRVTLVGSVDSRPTRETIGSRVRSISGVLSVNNLLETK